MKIIRLEVEGFRSLKDCVWEPGGLNLLIGPNAGGKSNLLNLIDLISVSAGGGLGEYVQRQGGMEPLVWDGSAEAMTIRLKSSPPLSGRDAERDSLTYELDLARLGRSSAYNIPHELLGNFREVERKTRNEPFKFIERSLSHAVIFDEEKNRLQATENAVPEEETVLSLASGPFLDNPVITEYRKRVASWSVYQDLESGRTAPIRRPVVSRREMRVSSDGSNYLQVLHTLYTTNRDFRREIDTAMRSAFGDEFEDIVFAPDADQRIQMRVQWQSLRTPQTAASLSDGSLRFLFLLAVLASPEPPALIAIDEPETGLHPSMLPIIAEYAYAASKRTQVVLTTHSPDLLNALGEYRPTTTIVEFTNGSTSLRTVPAADLAYWLEEYSLGDIYRTGELEAME
jgi:predicted ATPase